MIIDTSKISEEKLDAIGHLLNSGLRPDHNDKWEGYCGDIEYKKVFFNNKCLVEFGEIYNTFCLDSGYYHDKLVIDSLIGFPEKCDSLEVSNYLIKKIDYLPISEAYDFSGCEIEEINVKFPDIINNLILDDCKLSCLENMPEILDCFYISGSNFNDLENLPIIEDTLSITYNNKLEIINNIKGDLKEIYLNNLNNLKSIEILPPNLKNIHIQGCPNLYNIDFINNISEDCAISFSDCNALDMYNVYLNLDKNIKIHSENSNIIIHKNFFKYLKDHNITGISRIDYELALLRHLFGDNYVDLKDFYFKTKEASNKRDNLLKSTKTLKRFNL